MTLNQHETDANELPDKSSAGAIAYRFDRSSVSLSTGLIQIRPLIRHQLQSHTTKSKNNANKTRRGKQAEYRHQQLKRFPFENKREH